MKADLDTNLDGPASVNAAGNQQASGDADSIVADMFNAGAVRGAGPDGLAGIVVAALAGLTALASLVITRRRTVR